MTKKEKMKEIQKLLYEAYSKLLSIQIEDEENIEAQTEILSDINEIYKKIRENFNTSLWGEVDNEIKNKLNIYNLTHVYYDNGIYELEFGVDGKRIIITNIKEQDHPDAWADECYFDNEEIIKEIVRSATDNEIIIE